MMGPPSCGRRTRSTSRKSSSRRRSTTLLNKQIANSENQEISSIPPTYNISPVKSSNDDDLSKAEKNNVESQEMMCCSTPKAERFRIPEMKTCPPAPKKRRTVTSCTSLRRSSSIAFFASPDIELFFNFALCGIPV